MSPFILFIEATWWQLSLIAVQHWLQDRTSFVKWWCGKMKSFQAELKMDSLPWGHFVVDQVFHFIWLWFVMDYLTF